ncbi:MAG: carboxypeptidase regulatory-like domain-containing protein [Burkholderiaceae bacterium]|nr:carboxypeptidase regulatory-like domain-containing protein [Burkholderiaceae bacterium]
MDVGSLLTDCCIDTRLCLPLVVVRIRIGRWRGFSLATYALCIKESFYSLFRTMSRRAIKLTFLSLTLCASVFSQQFGGIRGQVVDSDFGQPIAKAQVTIMGSPFGAITDDQGNFTISGVPPGVYTIQTRAPSYIPKTVPDISVAAGSFNEMRFEAVAEIEEMEELVVPGSG